MTKQTSDIEPAKALMCLFTGHPGTRKTSAAASFPGPIYFFDFDGRMAPVKKVFPDRTDIYYDTFGDRWNQVDRMMKEIEQQAAIGQCPYKTIVVDSLTNAAECLIRYAKDNRSINKAMTRGVLNLTDVTDYNYETTGLSDLVSFMKTMNEDYKIHVILTAHLLRFEESDPSKGVGHKRTAFQLLTAGKKVAPKIPSVFDEHYHFEVESGAGSGSRVYAYTDNYGEYSAKTALPLPFQIEFTNRPFFEVLTEHLSAAGIVLEVDNVRSDE